MGNGILFPNYRPKSAALALIQKERHPRVYRYAEAAVRSKLGTSAQRESLWIEGYQRFGDEFEAVFSAMAGRFNNVKRPARLHNELESQLPDPWMIVGRRYTELHPSVQYAWTVFRFNRGDVIRLWLHEPKPPVDLEAIYTWATDGQNFDWERPEKTWTDRVTDDLNMTLAEVRRLMGYGITRDEVKEFQKLGFRSFSQFSAHFEDGIPIEYILAV